MGKLFSLPHLPNQITTKHICFSRFSMTFSTHTSKNGPESPNTQPPVGFPTGVEIENSFLFKHQNQLKSYPLPSLDSTLSKLKKFMLALAESGDKRAEEAVDAVITKFKNDQGPYLHSFLENRVNEKKNSYGWFYQWWNDVAYLKDRSPLVFYVSYFYAFKRSIFSPFVSTTKNEIENQCRIAALISASSILMRERILSGSIDPDKSNSHTLCSHMYKYLFNACRIARKPYDTTMVYDVNKHTHIIVLFKNKFFKIDGYNDDEPKTKRSFYQLESDFLSVIKNNTFDEGVPLGSITTMDRDSAAEGLLELENTSIQNKENLDLIRTAMFLICLDDSAPETIEERCRLFWHGNGSNRFFDKSIQFIVCKNGYAGLSGEHSMMDGTITNRFCTDMIKEIPSLHELPNSSVLSNRQNIHPFDWNINSSILNTLSKAKLSFNEHKKIHSFSCLNFTYFGKSKIKEWKLSPDSLVQMAFQLAYYRFSGGRFAASYESIQTRQFAFGRTDVARSPSAECREWIESLDMSSFSLTQKLALLEKAIKSHSSFAREVAAGEGIDRHLLGLSLAFNTTSGMKSPELFSNALFLKSKHWTLSTSQITSENNESWGYGEVVEDGFGLPYSIYDDYVYIGISSQSQLTNNTEKFKMCLSNALLSIAELIESVKAANNSFRSSPASL